MTSAYRHIANTDFAVQNGGGIRTDMFPKGAITVKQVYELDPFANKLMICKMTPKGIRQLIANGYTKEHEAEIYSSGFSSKIYIDRNENITNIKLLKDDGSVLDENKVYTVAMGSYLCNAYSFERTGNCTSVGITTTDALFKFLSQIKSIQSIKNKSTKIVKQ